MTRHLVTLMWNRRSRNLLVVAEMFFAFLVLFAVVLFSTMAYRNWRQPLGFEIERVWRVGVTPSPTLAGAPVPLVDRYQQVMSAIRDFPNVEAIATTNYAPYDGSNWRGELMVGERRFRTQIVTFNDAGAEVLRVRLTRGRWFGREDDGSVVAPVIVSERLALEAFGTRDAVGRETEFPDSDAPTRMRVVGVVQDYRKNGELARHENVFIRRTRVESILPTGDPRRGPLNGPPGVILVRVSPETTTAFEETLLTRLRAVGPDWTFDIQDLASLRATNLNEAVTPLLIFATVAGFLLLMVVLGLSGVVWQNVTERTREFGLRRAQGASARAIRTQVVGELLILTAMAMSAGVLLAVQAPLIPPLTSNSDLPTIGVVLVSVLVSIVTMFGLAIVSGWYPSRLATTIHPAEALYYE